MAGNPVRLRAHPAGQLALTVVLAVAMSVAVFLLLTTLGMERLPAGLVAVLVLLFPDSDATRRWAAANVVSLGIMLFALGATVSLRAFGANGRRRRLLLHAAGVALFVVSVLTYEVAVGFIGLSVLLYRVRVPWRAALTRWAVDLVAIVPILLLVTSHTIYARTALREDLRHVRTFASQSLTVLTHTLVPLGHPGRAVGPVIAVVVLVTGALRLRALRGEPDAAPLRRWLYVAPAGAGAVAVGYCTFLLSGFFVPLDPGLHNRVNALPSVGFALIAVALAVIAGRALLPHREHAATAVACAVVVALAAGYVVRVHDDATVWDRSAALQERAVEAVLRAVPDPPAPHSAVYAFGLPAHTGPGVPTYNVTNDLDTAVKARRGDSWSDRVQAYPVVSGAVFYCEPHDIWMDTGDLALDDYYGEVDIGRYQRSVFVDVGAGTARTINTPGAC